MRGRLALRNIHRRPASKWRIFVCLLLSVGVYIEQPQCLQIFTEGSFSAQICVPVYMNICQPRCKWKWMTKEKRVTAGLERRWMFMWFSSDASHGICQGIWGEPMTVGWLLLSAEAMGSVPRHWVSVRPCAYGLGEVENMPSILQLPYKWMAVHSCTHLNGNALVHHCLPEHVCTTYFLNGKRLHSQKHQYWHEYGRMQPFTVHVHETAGLG